MGPCILWCWSHRDGKEGINAPGLATQIDRQKKNMLQLGLLVLLAAVGEPRFLCTVHYILLLHISPPPIHLNG